MVHRISLYKFSSDVSDERLEAMMREARMHLLKIPEVLNVRCGKRIDQGQDWPFFVALEFDSMDKLKVGLDDPIHVTFVEKSIKPHVGESLQLTFEMEPFKDVRFS
jgi:hypothetical protein